MQDWFRLLNPADSILLISYSIHHNVLNHMKQIFWNTCAGHHYSLHAWWAQQRVEGCSHLCRWKQHYLGWSDSRFTEGISGCKQSHKFGRSCRDARHGQHTSPHLPKSDAVCSSGWHWLQIHRWKQSTVFERCFDPILCGIFWALRLKWQNLMHDGTLAVDKISLLTVLAGVMLGSLVVHLVPCLAAHWGQLCFLAKLAWYWHEAFYGFEVPSWKAWCWCFACRHPASSLSIARQTLSFTWLWGMQVGLGNPIVTNFYIATSCWHCRDQICT